MDEWCIFCDLRPSWTIHSVCFLSVPAPFLCGMFQTLSIMWGGGSSIVLRSLVTWPSNPTLLLISRMAVGQVTSWISVSGRQNYWWHCFIDCLDTVPMGAGEMIWSAKCLPCKHENLSSDPQQPYTKLGVGLEMAQRVNNTGCSSRALWLIPSTHMAQSCM